MWCLLCLMDEQIGHEIALIADLSSPALPSYSCNSSSFEIMQSALCADIL